MKPILQRLRRLEEYASRSREQGPSPSEILRARMARRLDGEPPCEEPKDIDNDYLNGCRTVSEILRSRFQRSGERGRIAEQAL
jgi:hypothetical protein